MRLVGYFLLAFALVAGSILVYQRVVDPKRTAEIGRLSGLLVERSRENAALSIALERNKRRLDSALTHVDSPIVRWRTLRTTDTLRIPVTATASDTAAALRKELATTREAGDSVVRACTNLQLSCAAFRDTAAAAIASWRTRYATLDSLYRAPRPGKRYHLSLSLGYGFSMRGDTLVRSPFVGVTVGRSLFGW